MTKDIYWSAYDLTKTLDNLTAQSAKDQVDVTIERNGRSGYVVSVSCNDNGRTGTVTGTLTVTESERVRLAVDMYRQRNRQMGMVLVPVVLGIGVWVASAQGSLLALVAVPLVLVAGANLFERVNRPRTMALKLLQEAVEAPRPARKSRLRGRMKKRQWGKH